MIVVIVQHFVRPGRAEAAERRVVAIGDRMRAMQGFLFRHALISSGDPNNLATITAWESREHYNGWLEHQRADAKGAAAASAEETPYVRVKTEVFSVLGSLDPSI